MDDSHIISLAHIVHKQVYYQVDTIDTIMYRCISICTWAASIQHMSELGAKNDTKTDTSDQWMINTSFLWPTMFTSKCTITSVP